MDDRDIQVLLCGVYLSTIIGVIASLIKMSWIPLLVIPTWIILWLIMLGGMRILE